VDPKGATLVAGFADGVVRSFILSKRDEQNKKGQLESELLLAQVSYIQIIIDCDFVVNVSAISHKDNSKAGED